MKRTSFEVNQIMQLPNAIQEALFFSVTCS